MRQASASECLLVSRPNSGEKVELVILPSVSAILFLRTVLALISSYAKFIPRPMFDLSDVGLEAEVPTPHACAPSPWHLKPET